MKRSILYTLVLCALGGYAHASSDQQIKKCADITNAAERLFCYDSLAAGLDQQPETATRAHATGATTTPPSESSINRNTRTQATPAAKPDSDNFGLEMQQARDSADEIRSRYDGSFDGWSGSTVFKLENGQVWKQAESDRLSMKAERPMITIKRGWFGAYYLKVDGANKSVKVKRVK